MERIFGLIPADKVVMEKKYRNERNDIFHLQANDEGWTIIFSDGSTEFMNVQQTTHDNFNEAYNYINSEFEYLIEIEDDNVQDF
jgi:hypothetical protein